MYKNPIKKGLKVQVEFNIGSKKNILDTYILEPDSDRLTLSFPDSKREFAPYLREGVEIKVFLYTFTGIIVVNSVVYDSPFDGYFVVEFNEENHIIQRRKYLRMPYLTDFFLQHNDINIKTTTADIGGGGIRFNSDYPFVANMVLNVQLRLNPYEPLIKAEGTIIKKNFYRQNEFVLEFTKIDEKDRDKIIQKCFLLETELNKNSM